MSRSATNFLNLLFAICYLLFLPACVTPYDPSGPPRLGIGDRGPGMAAPRAGFPSAPAQPQQALIISTAEPPLWATLASDRPLPTTLPDTPAAEQLQWVLSAMAGRENLRRISWRFSPGFLEQVPVEQFRTTIRQWQRDELDGGRPVIYRVLPSDSPHITSLIIKSSLVDRFSHIRVSVDEQGRIAGLFLAPAPDIDTGLIRSFQRVDQRLASLRGRVSLAAYELASGELRPVHLYGVEDRLAISSTFKLYVLGALADVIAAGEADWDQPLAIRDDLKSMGSGQMQIELEGREFPLERYAALMIGADDHTATDHLLHFLGRERVEQYMARFTSVEDPRNTPLLTTMELFKLKLPRDPALPERYIEASEAEQRAMLAPGGDVAKTIPTFAGSLQWRTPRHITGINWFASAQELARLMTELHRLEQLEGMHPLRRILRLNRGLAFDELRWPDIAYMGGSEPGVLNRSWLLTRADGRRFVVIATWNNPAEELDRRRLSEVLGAAIGLLAQDPPR